MPKKKVDERIRTLIENGVKTRTRSFFVIVGDRGKDQAVNLHYLLSKAQIKARPSVLWCYNKDLGFSTHRTKRMQKIKKLQARGVFDAEREDPFELFVSSTSIRWCYYSETAKVLGQTYGMAVLQDFEALTPNLLCRTVETVEGGGVVILLLHTMTSLRQLYTLAMDVHERFRTGAHADVVGRFNERFILSLANCASCLVLDDELNVLPISRHAKTLTALPAAGIDGGDDDDDERSGAAGGAGAASSGVKPVTTEAERELTSLKSSMASTALVGPLVAATRTLDQAKAVLTFAEAISEKTLRSTVALTAGRGRGKSAALGLAIAAAVAYGYANIFVTSPSPENLKTLFEFVFKGLEALSYKEHLDYDAIASSNPAYNRAIVRVNVHRGHRQTIQYIEPQDAAGFVSTTSGAGAGAAAASGTSPLLAQAELVVIDEAAAIPLPIVKRLLGPYLVFMASTVNGYEGTGRSLSLKLIQQLRASQAAGAGAGAGAMGGAGGAMGGSRTLREVLLNEPIRYAPGDAIEAWLNDLLCLDATTPYRLGGRLPSPSECELYAVDRDALFSYHKVSEAFLHRMMSLYVSSHYKNSPNDLQLMSDAPAHKLFVLLGPQGGGSSSGGGADDAAAGLPDILCVLQVCLEGEISKDTLKAALARGGRASGDLIPWTLAQQFQDDGFAGLSGGRVVRIATHPDATKMGYGSRALQLLGQFYSGQLATVALRDADGDEDGEGLDVDRGLHRISAPPASAKKDKGAAAGGAGAAAASSAGAAASSSELSTEKLKPRKELPPLLVNVADIRRPARLHWLGVSYGLTLQLFNFWRRGGYAPVYLRQTANELTAEHTMIMLRELDCRDMRAASAGAVAAPKPRWLSPFVADFGRRYASLLGFEFRSFDPTLALSVMDAAMAAMGASAAAGAEEGEGSAGAGAAAGGAGAAPSAGASVSSSAPSSGVLTPAELRFLLTPHDMKRLEAYARSQVDYHLILDLLPALARAYFGGRLPSEASLPRLQAGILLALGLQMGSIEGVAAHFDLAENQVLALFHKALRKVTSALAGIEERAAAAAVDAEIAAASAKSRAQLAASKAALEAAVSASAGKKASASSSAAAGAGGPAKAGAAGLAAVAALSAGELAAFAIKAPAAAFDAALASATKEGKAGKAGKEGAAAGSGKAAGRASLGGASAKAAAESGDSSSDSDSDSGSDSDSSSGSGSSGGAAAVPAVLRLPREADGSAGTGAKRKHGEMSAAAAAVGAGAGEAASAKKKPRQGGSDFADGEIYDAKNRLQGKGKHKLARSAR